jgi:hypothetical protein
MVQKLMMQQAVDQKGARYITDTLWMLMESGTEEVKVLQSVTLLLTTNTIVHGDTLARVCIIALHAYCCQNYFFTTGGLELHEKGTTLSATKNAIFWDVMPCGSCKN